MHKETKKYAKIRALAARSYFLAFYIAFFKAAICGLLAVIVRQKFIFARSIPGSVKLVGLRQISVGRNTSIGERSWLNVNVPIKNGYSIEIGCNCFIGSENFLSSGRIIKIGDYCLTTRGCSFIGSTHIYNDPSKPYLKTGTTSENRIVVGANCFFGMESAVIGDVTIGHGSVIGAKAIVRSSVPPFSLVVGEHGRVVKRYCFGRQRWVAADDPDLVEGPPEDEYLDNLKRGYGNIFLPISASRGFLFDVL